MILKQPHQDNEMKISVGTEEKTMPFAPSYGYVSPNQMLATIGSNDFLEISINQGNAAEKLKVTDGMIVTIHLA